MVLNIPENWPRTSFSFLQGASMRTQTRNLLAGAALALAFWCLTGPGDAQANKLAADLANLHGEGEASEAVLGKVSDIAALMDLLRPKDKGGEGLAAALQSNARLKGALNGIEEKIRALAKKKLADDRIGTE